ncbi:MAG: SufS family cysteine desulfurase [Candidatus Magasanikbacteria bacterium]|nr:SufS family cysteine desulfurase [Candidatus Magasanikbacteria bacterium]
MITKKIKQHFPIFRAHPNLAYLDSAATTQTPQVVIDAMNDYYAKYRSNVHRGLYDISITATEKYEAARKQMAKFLNSAPEEIIFNSGATFGLNALARSLSPRLSHRDNIVLTRMEHHANLVPWQEMSKHYGFEIRFIELDPTSYQLEPNSYNVIDENTKIVSLTQASNVLGAINPVAEIIKLAKQKSPKVYTIVDAAQAAAHLPIDVKKLDCDFLVLSGHKMYGPTGIGVLYGKKIMLEEHLEPFMFGGEMVSDVTYERATWNEVPYKFEAGTPPIAEAIGLSAAAEFITKIGMNTIVAHEKRLTDYALEKLTPLVNIIGPSTPSPSQRRGRGEVSRLGVISFTIPGAHPHDIGEIVNRAGVCVRVGHHCAMPLHKHLGLVGTARASAGVYTTKKDIDKLVSAIKEVKKIFG